MKRINRLWTKDDLFGRKQIIIPLTSEQLLQLKAEEAEKMKEQQVISINRTTLEFVKKLENLVYIENDL